MIQLGEIPKTIRSYPNLTEKLGRMRFRLDFRGTFDQTGRLQKATKEMPTAFKEATLAKSGKNSRAVPKTKRPARRLSKPIRKAVADEADEAALLSPSARPEAVPPHSASTEKAELPRVWDGSRLMLYSYHQIPAYLRDNDFILSGYRAVGMPFRDRWATLLHLHNQSGNIWTHLVPLVAALGLVLTLLLTDDVSWLGWATATQIDSLSLWDRALVCMYLVGAIICFSSSCLFHLHICGDHRAFEFYVSKQPDF